MRGRPASSYAYDLNSAAPTGAALDDVNSATPVYVALFSEHVLAPRLQDSPLHEPSACDSKLRAAML